MSDLPWLIGCLILACLNGVIIIVNDRVKQRREARHAEAERKLDAWLLEGRKE